MDLEVEGPWPMEPWGYDWMIRAVVTEAAVGGVVAPVSGVVLLAPWLALATTTALTVLISRKLFR